MAKDQNVNTDTYIVESTKQDSKFKTWLNRRPVKITAIAVAGVLALGLAFTGGALAGRELDRDHQGPGFAHEFDRDHNPKFDGERPDKPGHNFDGDQDGQFKFDGGASDTTKSPETPAP
jgi:hypothetical protein